MTIDRVRGMGLGHSNSSEDSPVEIQEQWTRGLPEAVTYVTTEHVADEWVADVVDPEDGDGHRRSGAEHAAQMAQASAGSKRFWGKIKSGILSRLGRPEVLDYETLKQFTLGVLEKRNEIYLSDYKRTLGNVAMFVHSQRISNAIIRSYDEGKISSKQVKELMNDLDAGVKTRFTDKVTLPKEWYDTAPKWSPKKRG